MENKMTVSFTDKLKAIYDKDLALKNAIIEGDFDSFKKITDKNPEILASKHAAVVAARVENSAKMDPHKRMGLHNIQTELTHLTEQRYAKEWTVSNDLMPNAQLTSSELLKSYIAADEPSIKEPIITYLKDNFKENVMLLTKEQLDRKLSDFALSDYGGKKISEDDIKAVVQFAKTEAIKTNNLEAYKHLDKEFGISEMHYKHTRASLYENAFIASYKAEGIKQYVAEQAQLGSKAGFKQQYKGFMSENVGKSASVAELKLNTVEQNANLKRAIDNGDPKAVTAAILEGADEKLVNKSTTKGLDPNVAMEIYKARVVAVTQRANMIPEVSRFNIKDIYNNDLIDAYKDGDALKGYCAVKAGADTTCLRGVETELSLQEETKFKIAITDAVNELSLNPAGKDKGLTID